MQCIIGISDQMYSNEIKHWIFYSLFIDSQKLRCSVNWKCCTFMCATVLHHALIIRIIGQHILCTHMFPWCLSKSLPHHRHTWAISELSAVPQAFVRPISVCFSPPRPPRPPASLSCVVARVASKPICVASLSLSLPFHPFLPIGN